MTSRHNSYKASGLEWAPEIPSHWSTMRLRHLVRLNPSRAEIAHLHPATEVAFLPMESIGENGQLALDRQRPIMEVESGYSYFRDGDVVVAKITPCFENGKGAVMRDLPGGCGFGTTELIVARPRPGRLLNRYLFFVFSSPAFRGFGEGAMYGAGGQKRVPDDFVRDFAVPVPPIGEQMEIAVFLEEEVAKIDALIKEQERLVELLEEKRHAYIVHAVTKGVDDTCSLRESEVEWIGRLPSHWELRRVKDVARLESGHTPSKQVPEYWENCTIPWVSLNDSKQLAASDYISETAVEISELGMANSSARLLPTGAVVFTRDATIGLAAITTRPMAVSQHVIAWCPGNDIRADYLLRVFNAMSVYLEFFTFGATIKTIGMGDVRKLVTPVPPLKEQGDIVRAIDRHNESTDLLIGEAKRSIKLLNERRASLILAAIAGSIRVAGRPVVDKELEEAV